MSFKVDKVQLEIILKGDATRVEIRKLEDEAKSLQKELKGMKEGTEEYAKTASEYDKVKSKIKELHGTIDLTAKTMRELTQRSRELRWMLNNAVPGTAEWKAYDAELKQVNARMSELRGTARTTESFFSLSNLSGGVGKFLGIIGVGVLSVGKLVGKAKELVEQSIEMAQSAEGIDIAFNRIADRDYLKTLRAATKGMVNDMQLMKAAVKAENFNIPLNNLGTLLGFAQQRAKDTGENIDYLVDSIVNGIGRKSPMILDNLGISAVKLNQEVKKTGDFAGAVAKIVEEEMSKIGTSVDTTSDAVARKKAAWENLQLSLGKRFLSISTAWNKLAVGFTEGLEDMVRVQKKATEQYDDHLKKVADLEANIIPLVERYKVLKSETNLSVNAQKELKTILNTIQQSIPGVVTEVDKYGNALSINTDKVYAYITAEKLKLKYLNKNAIEESEKGIKEQEKVVEKLREKILKGDRYYTTETGRLVKVRGKYNTDEVNNFKLQLQQEESLLAEKNEALKILNGQNLDEEVQIRVTENKKRNEFNAMTEKQLKRYIEMNKDAAGKYLEIAKEVYQNKFASTDTPESDKSKKSATKNPYSDSLKELEEAQKKELLALKNGLISKTITEDEFAKQGEAMLRQHLEDKLFLQKFWGESTVDTEIAIADNKLASQKTADERLLDQLKETNESRLQSLENWDQLAKNMLQDDVDAGLITSKQYQERLRAIELTSAQEKLRIAKDYLSEVENGEFHSQEAKEKAVKEATKAVVQATKDEEKAVKESTKSKLKAEEEYQKNREQVLKQYGLQSIRDRYRAELKLLKEHLKDKLITEKEFEQAKFLLKLKAAEEYAQKAVQFAGYVADAVSAYHQMEADSLEEQKQRELSAAGDNAEKREQIEKDYAQKELDLKKKQANADMAIKITQAVAAGALAAIQAYGAMGGNPIAGAIAAGIVAGITAMQIASIKKQRDILMATTLNSSVGSSGNSGNNFSNLVANSQLPQTNQAADGRYDVVGADDGRTYRRVPYGGRMRSGVIGTPTLVAERGDELIIDHPTLRNIRLNAPHLINDMLRYRVQQRGSGHYSNVGESDSYTGKGSGVSDELVQALLELLEKNTSLLQWLKENRIEAYTVLSDFEKKRELRDKSVKRGSL